MSVSFFRTDAGKVVRATLDSCKRYCVDEFGREALSRLATSAEAALAWSELEKAALKVRAELQTDVMVIGLSTAHALYTATLQKSRNDVLKARAKAITLSKQLSKLIRSVAHLQVPYQDLLSDDQRRAMSRLLYGTFSTGLLNAHNPSEPTFRYPEAAEQSLEDESNFNVPADARAISTGDAYVICGLLLMSNLTLADQLERYIKQLEPLSIRVRTAHPKTKGNEVRLFCTAVFSGLSTNYGSRLPEVVTAIASVVFDRPIDVQTVRKWWQRHKDK